MGLSSTSTQLACFCFIAAAQAFTTFHPNCTIPTTTKSYVSGPNSRGSFEILWGSLFTIFACTWTIHHPNVPRQRHGYKSQNISNEDKSWRSYLKNWRFHMKKWRLDMNWHFKTFLKSTGRMVLTIFAPEVIIAVAFNGTLAALADHKLLKEQAKKDGVEWSLTHTYYANMGGFVIEKTRGPEDEAGNEYNLYHLSGRDLHILRKRGHIQKLPNITTRGLKDRSKSDAFVKAISVTQIVWSTAQILVRGVRHLSICPLELTVLAFAACAVIIYGLYWKKPKSIGVTTTLTVKKQVDDVTTTGEKQVCGVTTTATNEKQVSDDDIKEMLVPESNGTTPKDDANSGSGTGSDRSNSINPESIENYSTEPMFFLKPFPTMDGAPMRIDTVRKGGKFDYRTLAALLLATMLFGAIHIGAWHFPFPTRVDLLLWKCATFYSVSCAFIPFIAASLLKVADKHKSTLLKFCGDIMNATDFLNKNDHTNVKGLLKVTGILNFTSILLYIIARLVIIVEMLRTLFFLPPDAFVSSWSSSLPHLA